jgi:hypothetical protein
LESKDKILALAKSMGVSEDGVKELTDAYEKFR